MIDIDFYMKVYDLKYKLMGGQKSSSVRNCCKNWKNIAIPIR